ncbi:hypothetical protein ACI2KR_27430 [Pseudomonas luteola]
MIAINGRTGELFLDGKLVEDSEVLWYLNYQFSVVEQSEEYFCLQTVYRLLKRYPNLAKLNGWSAAFIDKASQIQPKIGLVGKAPLENSECLSGLAIGRQCFVEISEMTCVSVDFDNGVKLSFENKPSTKVMEYPSMWGYIDDMENHDSLSYRHLEDLYYLPIRLVNKVTKVTMSYANEARNNLDYARHTQSSFKADVTGLSLHDLIYVVMMELNLEDSDDIDEVVDVIQDRLSEAHDKERKSSMSLTLVTTNDIIE